MNKHRELDVAASPQELDTRSGLTSRLRSLQSEQWAWIGLLGAMVCAEVTILWLNRGTTFWTDEVVWFMESPGLDIEGAFQPYLGHLVLVPRLVYKAVFETLGSSYVPFRLLALAALLLLVAVLFLYLRRRVGGLVALAACVVPLFFGSDKLHVLVGNGFTVLLALACGVGALLVLEREDRRGDAFACVLLSVGVLTYSVALPFLAGAAVWLLLSEGRLRRAWVVAIPALIWGSWWLWTQTLPVVQEDQVTLQNLLVLPAWAFQSLSAALEALVGVSFQFAGGATAPRVGPVLAVLAVVALGLRFRAGMVPKGLWAALAVLGALWMLGVLAAGGIRFPEGERYLYPAVVALLLVAAQAARGLRWSRAGLIGLYLVAAAGLGANLLLLDDASDELRNSHTPNVRAGYAALEIAGPAAEPRFGLSLPDGSGGPDQSEFGFPLTYAEGQGDEAPAWTYIEAAEEYGGIGYSLEQLRDEDDYVRYYTDAVLTEAMELRLEPAAGLALRPDCAVAAGGEGPTGPVRLPPGGAAIEMRGRAAGIFIGRFEDEQDVPLGELAPSQPARLRIPVDRAPDPWRVAADAGTLVVCPPPRTRSS